MASLFGFLVSCPAETRAGAEHIDRGRCIWQQLATIVKLAIGEVDVEDRGWALTVAPKSSPVHALHGAEAAAAKCGDEEAKQRLVREQLRHVMLVSTCSDVDQDDQSRWKALVQRMSEVMLSPLAAQQVDDERNVRDGEVR